MRRCRECTRYELGARGVRVISGRNEDDDGAASNGAGKSALVMAPLWALAGRSDARSEARKRSPCLAMGLHATMHQPSCVHGPSIHLPACYAYHTSTVLLCWRLARVCPEEYRLHTVMSAGHDSFLIMTCG